MKRMILLSAVFLCLAAGRVSAASVTDFGTNGIDDTKAFEEAMALSDCAEVPAGEYYLKSLSVPANKKITGDAENRPVLHVLEDGNQYLFDMKVNSELANVIIVNDAGKEQAIHVEQAKGIKLSGVELSDFYYGVYNDHGDNMICDGMRIYNIENTGITTIFASGITVKNSIVEDCKNHGIQFWNNWNGERRGGNLIYEGNTVTDIANGGIWGSGAVNVVMTGNTVDNCGDVGLDLEYVQTAEIYGNTVMRCANGGVSCFMTCDGVKIHDNRIYNNKPEYEVNDYMAGIWLTYENNKYDYDTGNKNIDIYNNFIYCIPDSGGHTYTREAVRICTRNYNEKNITLSDNTILGMPYRILFDTADGLKYGYNANMAFDADGLEYSIASIDENNAAGQYKLRNVSYCCADVTSQKSFTMRNIINESGASEVSFYITPLKIYTGARVQMEIMNSDSGEIITSKTMSGTSLNGEKVSLYYDRTGTDNVSFKVSAENAEVRFDKIEVGMAKLAPFELIKTVNGTELLNNSYCRLKTTFVFRKPADKYGVKSYITITSHSSNAKRQKVSASWIDFE